MKKLASIIINAIKGELQADAALFAQAQSLVGAFTFDELKKALLDPNLPEGQVLLELLFSPGEGLLLRLEEHLPQKGLSANQTKKLEQAVLAALPVKAKIACHGLAGPPCFWLDVPAFGAMRFVRSLNPGADLGEQIPGFLQKREKKQALAVRCLVRQAGIVWTEASENFFLAFLEQADWQDANFMLLVQKALEFMAHAPKNILLGPYLESIIRWCRLHLEQARQTRTDLAGMNMETRLALGVRPPYADEARLGQTLGAAERIYGLVFGPLLPGTPVRASEQALNPCNPQDLRLAIRSLLGDER
ncbi:MAG: hypothetical protein QMD09_07555 [Desulfatibacillaceae bacterium]|nr:hypothetical protein [Desulfatibacillaceae bacterium]